MVKYLTNTNAVVAVIGKHEVSYVSRWRKYFTNFTFKVVVDEVKLLYQIQSVCKSIGATRVVCSQEAALKKIMSLLDPDATGVSVENYAGTVLTIPMTEMFPAIEVLILPPPKNLLFVPEMDFLVHRWTRKLVDPNFPVFPELDWKILGPSNIDYFLEEMKSALMVAIDIETTKKEVDMEVIKGNPEKYRGIWALMKKSKSSKKLIPMAPIIRMVGYSMLLRDSTTGELYSKTGVLTIKDMLDIEYMRKLNDTPAAKVMQNGQYDCTYFIRYNAPVRNYLYDTFLAMHSWYVELSRDLAFIASLFDKGSRYWKDGIERDTELYNARDCHNTLWSMVHIINQWPDWAARNYAENFRMVFPCITCGLDGWRIDLEKRSTLHLARIKEINKNLGRLHKIVGAGFNPNSSQQVLKLMHGLGYKKATSSDETTLKQFSEAHPLYNILAQLIMDVRGDRKAVSTYFEATLFDERLLFELNPGGTDTGRLASKASNLWTGTQIQNTPFYAKPMMVADVGWELGSADNEQSESRCTAYMSEDANLIRTVEAPQDFHKTNATMFFGIPYEEITKEIRDTAKRVNHGANYNMGPGVLLDTMGRRAVLKAARLLELPRSYSLIDICSHLLDCFSKAYPDVKGKFYNEICEEILFTGRLTGPTGWTRRCFGNPRNTKRELNLYVAHGPQSLSVKIINAAFFDAWLKYQIQENVCRFKAQVHDDLIWQTRPEHTEYVGNGISALMMRPTVVRGRSMVIPNKPILGKKSWAELKD